jgi:hypothetical protein
MNGQQARRGRFGALSVLSYKAIVFLIVALVGFEPTTSRLEVEVSLFYGTIQWF